MNKLSDKDFSDWLSKTGLGLFDDILERKKENLDYYSAALLWIQKRFNFSESFSNLFSTCHIFISDTKESIEKQNKLIKSIIEKIRDSYGHEIDMIKGLVGNIQRELNKNQTSDLLRKCQTTYVKKYFLDGKDSFV